MKILLVTNMYPTEEQPVYGAFIRDQVESLRRAGAEVEVVFLDGRISDLEYAHGIRLVRGLAGPPFDVVHAHYGLTGFVAACQRALPLVVTFHGDDLFGTPGDGGRTTLKSRAARRLAMWAAGRSAAIVVQSAAMRDLLPARLRPRTRVLPMGIDLERFRPLPREECCARLGLDPSRRRILFLADPERVVKRFALAAAAARIVRHRFPDADLHVVAGRPPQEVPFHINACDVLVLTSMHEGGPSVVREALACDLPVVSVPVGDVAERIGKVAGCHLVPPEVEALATALEEVLAIPGRVAGRATVEAVALSRIASELLAIYGDAVASRRGPSGA